MRAKYYQLIDRCVEAGTESGLRRAHKHTDTPTEDQLKHEITSAIMLEISETFDFPEPVHSDEVTIKNTITRLFWQIIRRKL